MRCVIPAVLCCVAPFAEAELRLHALIDDHMVLQRGVAAPVWGWADPGERVQVEFAGKTYEAAADETGAWLVSLDRQFASSEPRSLVVRTDDESITVEDVLVGEVWLCSGQSNMVWRVNATLNGEQFAAEADDPRIRMFTIPNTAEHEPQDDCRGEWVVSSPETTGQFSATAYHFARHLMPHLDMPIGLVNASWGGSTVEAWVSRGLLEEIPEAAGFLEAYDEFHEMSQMDVAAFIDPDADENDWIGIELPQSVEAAGHAIDGVFWFRRSVEIPASWVGRDLVVSLGQIDDNDITFVNGVRIGATNNWQAKRRYTIPGSAVTSTRLTFAVRVEDTGGGGGFVNPSDAMVVSPAGDASDSVDLSGWWKMSVAATRPSGPTQHRPSNLYNGMIHPLRNMAFRGVIWYQGESNAIRPRGEEYLPIFSAMIADWRMLFERADIPFYYVQLPLFTNNEANTVWRYPVVRQAQLEVMRLVPHTGMAVTLDLGEADDIHPRNKHDVGERLARWALVETYGASDIVASAPIVREGVVEEEAVVVEFDLYGGRLQAMTEVGGFELAGEDGVFHAATARVDGDRVRVTSEAVGSPRAVRYAWLNNPTEANLVNSEGLPASPFLLSLEEDSGGR